MPEPRLQLRLSERRLLLIGGDVLAILLSVLIALRIWAHVGRIAFDSMFITAQAGWFVVLSGLWLLLASVNDFYDRRITAKLGGMFSRLLRIMGELLIIYLALFFVSSRDALPRLFILYHAALSSVLIGVWRGCQPLLGWSAFRRRALIVGTGWAAETILDTLAQEAPHE